MESADALLGGFASGDTVPGAQSTMKRDQDSTDDFEHLESEGKQDAASESPLHQHRTATQSFLDMERAPAIPLDHIADKFTDSESDADTAGESPLHRPAPSAPALDPPASAHDPIPVLAPTTAPAVPAPVVSLEKLEPKPALVHKPEPELKPNSAEPELKSNSAEPELKSRLAEQKPVEPKPVEAKPVEPKPVEPKPVEPKPVEPKHVEPKPVAPKPAAPKPADAESVQPARAPIAHVIEAEVIFCQMGLVESLIYWRSPVHSGVALGAGLALLVALACCSVVSVLAYASLLVLSAAVAFRIYKNVLQAVQKTNDGHPFKWLLEKDIRVPAERAQSIAAAATAHLNALLHELRSLFLVEDLVDSLKFGVMLWCGTYLGACFNGITLIILGWIALFTLPKAYEMNKEQVDANLELARSKINEISAKVRAAVPLGRKSDADKDK